MAVSKKLAIIGSRGFPSTYGGYETLVRHLARHLVAENHHVTVYCRGRRARQRSWITEHVRCIAAPGRDTKSLSTLSYGLTSTCDAMRRGYDAALVLNIANGFWMPGLRAAGIPFAVNTDGIEWERGKWNRVGQTVFKVGARLTARHATTLVCDSEAIGAIWKRDFARTSTFIPYGAPVLDDVDRDRLEGVHSGRDPYVLVVARLAPENNVDLALDAIEVLGSKAPKTIIVGSGHPGSPIVGRLERLSNAGGAISWLGHVADQRLLTQLWAHAGVYVHGHSVGGTNPALLQALGCGAPTLALDTLFNREVLPHDDQIFPPEREALAERIQTVVGSPTTQEIMRRRGKAIIRTRYRWDDVCARYADLLVSLAANA